MSRTTIRLAALLFAGALAACGGKQATAPIGKPYVPPTRPTLDPTYRASGHAAAGDVFVHLFEWRWTDIASECESVLGPAGFRAVQVSPPQEHSITPSHDWSERYQPVSYSIAKSRSGTGVEFADMVARCKAAGVDIYVDAVINHMTNFPSPGTGSNGTAYTKYDYPGLYTAADFHLPACTVNNYANAAEVQDCELFSLPDLNTGLESVRRKIAAYLVMLARLGVAGFRIDAAKHIQQVELDRIITIVDSTMVAEGKPRPYWFLEVSAGFGEALSPRDYYGEAYASGGTSDITEFIFVGVGDKFRQVGGQHISQLNPNGSAGNQFSPAAWGMMPSDKAVVFLQNHDTQHNGGISYRDGQTFRLANVWMLAQPYGYPSILSSYAFSYPTQNSMGPPSDPDGWTLPVTCASSLESATVGQWVCEHRDPYIRNMVAFRKYVAGTDVNHWWDDGNNAIAFSRGDRGFVAINRESSAVTATIATGLPAGSYCDLLTGGKSGASCVGTTVVIDASGAIALTLGANSAVAIDGAVRL
ncbi:MAG: ATPase [Gemmatimonadaceae bacterium]|nr:ATPase [Gemmatimonadaceae bacterium]NUQ92732.1 ATPase [Gemmatimonadaceae bacterium]NUR18524.1 ATPase [Gemmatimonadaceae bacterium]